MSGIRRSGRKKQRSVNYNESSRPKPVVIFDLDDEEDRINRKRKGKGKVGETCNRDEGNGVRAAIKNEFFHTRSSPKTLSSVMSTLNPSQKACLDVMGFTGFIDFSVDSIPTKLALFVVDSFHPESMEIKLPNVAILIKKLFGIYLSSIRCPIGKTIQDVSQLEVAEFDWQTTRYKQTVNGLVIMRLMEAYFGEDLSRFDCGFNKSKFGNQLELLKQKYVTRILMSDDNMAKTGMKKMADASAR